MNKTERTALITGSGRNIGRACALALAADGVNLVVNGSSDQEACEQTAAMARELGVKAEVALGNVGQEADAKKIAAKALLHFDAVDILICNAAIRPSDAFLEMTDEQWYRVINTNFMGSFWLARACLPGMVDKGWGRIINFAGMNAIHGYNGRAHVSASKHAVWGLTKALAKEFAPKGITANIISPGPIEGERNDLTMAAHIAEMVDRVPVGRLGTGDEVAAACALLASDKGGFINGQMIQINGGAET
ncbi:MAG: 3-oxoacyl-ACP reductase [Magnetovibrio sp.]|nr:3-oxoacyl-ACP reductase [Magnetovibrio sp.]